MTFRKKVFVSQKISVLVDHKELKVQALVSSYGAKYVFQQEELPPNIVFDKEVELLYKNIPVRCSVIKETTAAGTVYSFRFLNPSGLLLRQIERDVKENGLPSPWLRSLPRLDAGARNLPVPALMMLNYRGETIFLNVKNFTLGGMLAEYVGEALDDLNVGNRLDFDLVTNGGEKINDLSASISHISVETGSEESLKLQIGLKFLRMNFLSESKYRDLIREHCLGLREGPTA